MASALRVRPFRLAASLAAAVAFSALLGACGGTNDGVFVSSLAASPTQFSKSTVVTVSGVGLDRGVSLVAESGCDDVVELPGGNSQTRRYSCTVSAVGGITIRALNDSGTRLARLDFVVPQPEVTFTFGGLGAEDRTVVVRLDAQRAPLSSTNFLAYVNAGFYRNTIIHRVDSANGVVQGGGFTTGPVAKDATRDPVVLESRNGLLNLRGSVGMARTGDPDSATSQFYFNVRDNPGFDYLDSERPGYAVFASVVQGIEAIDEIFAVATQSAAVIDTQGNPVLVGSGLPLVLPTVPTSSIVIRSAAQSR